MIWKSQSFANEIICNYDCQLGRKEKNNKCTVFEILFKGKLILTLNKYFVLMLRN